MVVLTLLISLTSLRKNNTKYKIKFFVSFLFEFYFNILLSFSLGSEREEVKESKKKDFHLQIQAYESSTVDRKEMIHKLRIGGGKFFLCLSYTSLFLSSFLSFLSLNLLLIRERKSKFKKDKRKVREEEKVRSVRFLYEIKIVS